MQTPATVDYSCFSFPPITLEEVGQRSSAKTEEVFSAVEGGGCVMINEVDRGG